MNKGKSDQTQWLGLMVGNSRLHWGWFTDHHLLATWDTPHLELSAVQQLINQGFHFQRWINVENTEKISTLPVNITGQPPLWIASVVPQQLKLWHSYAGTRIITLENLPELHAYPSLGIDRALALWGAGTQFGWPILTIDAGTALTLTAANSDKKLAGGVILPGLGLQLQSLGQKTAALPLIEIRSKTSLPPRWALNTPDAITSGVVYTILAGIRDFIHNWWQEYPNSPVTLTGGDGKILHHYLQILEPELSTKIIFQPHLILSGMAEIVTRKWEVKNI